jgi:hypothetical protein
MKPFSWKPFSITPEQFWSQIGVFAYSNSESLIGVTSLVFNGTTNREGIDIENVPNLVSFDARNLSAITGGYFELSGCPLLTTINLSALVSCAGDLNISSNAALTTINLGALAVLAYRLIASGCALDAAEVNAVLARLVAATSDGSTPWANTVDLSGGTNAAPTGQGITDAATLVGRGATVTTN